MILVGGENLIDFIESSDGTFTANLGGGPFNIAKALARQGQKVGYLTPISTDQMGDRLAADLAADGVDILAPRSHAPTSLALVSLVNGQPSYQFYRQKTAERQVSSTMLNRIIPKQATAFQLGSLALTSGKDADAWAQIYRAKHQRGMFTSLDPNIRPAFIKNRRKYLTRLDWILPKTDMLKLSDEDLNWFYPKRSLERAAAHLRAKHDIPLLVLTRGAEGATGFTEHGQFCVSAPKADPFVDAVGAGDTFMGTLLAQLSEAGLLNRLALENAAETALRPILEMAAKAAAMNCETSGCNPPYKADLIMGRS
ncbi:MAG: carbohydrate kinase [Rhodobacteraceae bacterium]|nr:carbohydrate kinase [Paracoccaceae bacterium]